jgi:predicted acylesterase/phospholipase RssA
MPFSSDQVEEFHSVKDVPDSCDGPRFEPAPADYKKWIQDHSGMDPDVWALVCQGGGGKGAWQGGVLYGLMKEGQSFRALFGTSAGALNCALYLAAEQRGNPDVFKDVWCNLNSDEIYDPWFRLPWRRTSRKLHRIIHRYVNPKMLATHFAKTQRWLYLYATGCPMVDPYPFCFRPSTTQTISVRDSFSKLRRALLASAAIPYVFPSVWYEGSCKIDGGLVANNPIDVAVDSNCGTILCISPSPVDTPTSLWRRLACPLYIIEYMTLKRIRLVKDALDKGKLKEAFLITPSKHIPNGLLCFDSASSKKSFDMGIADADAFLRCRQKVSLRGLSFRSPKGGTSIWLVAGWRLLYGAAMRWRTKLRLWINLRKTHLPPGEGQ